MGAPLQVGALGTCLLCLGHNPPLHVFHVHLLLLFNVTLFFIQELRTGTPVVNNVIDSNIRVNNELDRWCTVTEKKTEVEPGMFPLWNRDAWIHVFLRYNTLILSSAAVERLFSLGSDIIKPKRSRLTAENFERLVFLKGNNDLLNLRFSGLEGDERN